MWVSDGARYFQLINIKDINYECIFQFSTGWLRNIKSLGNKINCSFEIQQIVDYSVIKFKTLRPRTVYWTNMYSLALQWWKGSCFKEYAEQRGGNLLNMGKK